MTRRLPALLAACAVGVGLFVAAPTAEASPVPPTAVNTSGRVMCLVIQGQPQGVCLDYPGVLNLVGDLIP